MLSLQVTAGVFELLQRSQDSTREGCCSPSDSRPASRTHACIAFMSTPDDLKRAKIAFVSNNKGDSLFRINVICVTALVCLKVLLKNDLDCFLKTTYGLWTAIQAGYRLKGPQLLLADFLILCLPLLLVLTVLADHALLFNALITGVVMLLYNNNAQSKPVTSKSQAVETKATHRRVVSEVSQLQSPAGNKKPFYQPFVTVYRAHMMLMTVICILAVDFPAFPRSFGKCETWGTSIVCDVQDIDSLTECPVRWTSVSALSSLPWVSSKHYPFSEVNGSLLSALDWSKLFVAAWGYWR